MLWEEGEGADTEGFEQNAEKMMDKLPAGGLQDGSIFTVEDFSQDLELEVCVHHRDDFDPLTEPDGFRMGKPSADAGSAAAADSSAGSAVSSSSSANTNGAAEPADVTMTDTTDATEVTAGSAKRPLADEQEPPSTWRTRV
eukprot:FR736149.1.p1 GENE.FR736149.1~~FR736149.1.p1  ORF type:complete len:162 (+),score=17.97 FR736149.1:64-486(+)